MNDDVHQIVIKRDINEITNHNETNKNDIINLRYDFINHRTAIIDHNIQRRIILMIPSKVHMNDNNVHNTRIALFMVDCVNRLELRSDIILLGSKTTSKKLNLSSVFYYLNKISFWLLNKTAKKTPIIY